MFKELDDDLWLKVFSRALVIGPPNSLKTTSLLSWPRPIGILSYPGEKGSGTIPVNAPGVRAWVWEDQPDENGKEKSASQKIAEIEKITVQILTSGIKTFAGDGLIKLAGLMWTKEYVRQLHNNEELLAKGKITEDELKLRAYGNENFGSCKATLGYINKVCQSGIENVVFTCWDGEEKDNPGERKGPSHTYADLPGRLARRIVGEFGVTLFSHVSLPDPQGKVSGSWQIRPKGSVWGVGIKVPPAIAKKMPTEVPQNWNKLVELLQSKVKEVSAAA